MTPVSALNRTTTMTTTPRVPPGIDPASFKASAKGLESLDDEGDDEVDKAYSRRRGANATCSPRRDHTATETIGTTRKRGALTELQREKRKTRRYGIVGVEEDAFDPLNIESPRASHTYDDEDYMTDWMDHVEAGVEPEGTKSQSLDPDPHEGRAYSAGISVSSKVGASPILVEGQPQLVAAPPRPSVSSSPRTHADVYLPNLPDPPPHHWLANSSLPSHPSPNTTSAPTSPVETRPMHQRLGPPSPSLSYSHSYHPQSPPVRDSSVPSNPSHPHPERYPNLPSPPPLPSHLATTSRTQNQYHPHTFAHHDYRYLPTPPPQFFTSHPMPSTFRSREEQEQDDRDRNGGWGRHGLVHDEDRPIPTIEQRRWGETAASGTRASTLGGGFWTRTIHEGDQLSSMDDDYESGATRQEGDLDVGEDKFDDVTGADKLVDAEDPEATEFDERERVAGVAPGHQSMRTGRSLRPGCGVDASTQHYFLPGPSKDSRTGHAPGKTNGIITTSYPFVTQHEDYSDVHHAYAGERFTGSSSRNARPRMSSVLPAHPSLMKPNNLDNWELEMMGALLNIGSGS
ncbi:hypothetical protein DL93DRAFT_2087132 [Clavulina sp. PMI_390]|nr:hypothetical protein DL93DRAFT_2087132 [Clavulina sp. PMI_390]